MFKTNLNIFFTYNRVYEMLMRTSPKRVMYYSVGPCLYVIALLCCKTIVP